MTRIVSASVQLDSFAELEPGVSRAPGYVRIYRSMADCEDRIWNSVEKFDSRSARLDLILYARFAPGRYATVHGVDVLARGEFVGSLRFWATRWRWTVKRVRTLFRRLTDDGFIRAQRKAQHGSVYLIVNYDRYQSGIVDAGTREGVGGARPGHTRGTNTKKDKKERASIGGDLKSYPDEFEAVWRIFPRRSGGNSKREAYSAWCARRREGISVDQLHSGVERYITYCEVKGIVGTEFVKQAKTFFGSGEHWREPWDAGTNNRQNGRTLPTADKVRSPSITDALFEDVG